MAKAFADFGSTKLRYDRTAALPSSRASVSKTLGSRPIARKRASSRDRRASQPSANTTSSEVAVDRDDHIDSSR